MEETGPQTGEPRLPGRAARRRSSWWEEWGGGTLVGAAVIVALLYAFWRPLRPLVVAFAFAGIAWAGWQLAAGSGVDAGRRWLSGFPGKLCWPSGKGKRRRHTEHKRW